LLPRARQENGLLAESRNGPTKGLQILKAVKKKRFEETVLEKALLMDRGGTFSGLLITKKLTRPNDTMKTNEESTSKW
jgi:hypothetical protein